MNNTIGDMHGIIVIVLFYVPIRSATYDILQLSGILLQSCVEVIYWLKSNYSFIQVFVTHLINHFTDSVFYPVQVWDLL